MKDKVLILRITVQISSYSNIYLSPTYVYACVYFTSRTTEFDNDATLYVVIGQITFELR